MVPFFEDTRRRDVVLIVVCVVLHLMLVGYSRIVNGTFGFPLDDAWIFQTYSRNLAELGQWAFVPGEPSTASTSVLWTPLLVPGHWLPSNPVWWGYFLGLLSYILTALGVSRLVEEKYTPFVGLAVAMEWHLLWSSGTGMDTLLFTALLVWFWVWVKHHQAEQTWQNGLVLGVFGGVLMLARPEGLLALAVAGLWGLIRKEDLRKRLLWGASAGVGFAIVLVPLVAANLAISGEIWPSTFYAKQAEYAALWQKPLVIRFFQQAATIHIGALLITLPGFIYFLYTKIQQKDWHQLLPVMWVVLHWFVYAYRLPVTYQNARYAIPTIPIITAFGVVGLMMLAKPKARDTVRRLVSRVWLMLAIVAFPASAVVWGMTSFASNVTFIENDMVNTAMWIAENRSEGDIVAAHDIGAMGYFAPGPLIDLAGLVSPEVVPFMTDYEQLADYIIDQEADYLVIFPGWSPAYSLLAEDPRFCEIYAASEAPDYELASERLGSMTIYTVGDCE